MPDELSEHGPLAPIVVILGGAAGASVGLVAYVYMWLTQTGGDQGALGHLHNALIHVNPVFYGFVLGGGLLGLALAALALGREGELVVRRGLRASVGVMVGGTAGFVVYAIGFVALTVQELPASRAALSDYASALATVTPMGVLLVILGATVGLVIVRYSWRFYGILSLLALITIVLGFVSYSILVTLPDVPATSLPFSLTLLLAEMATLSMVVLYSFYTLDVLARKRWRRHPDAAQFSKYYLPKVVFHVPCFNEPPELVKGTLESLLAVDYPKERYVIMLLDDSTEEDTRAALERYCEDNGITYVHREERGGFKAGALNEGLRRSPEDVELIAVIDADYQVSPDYLAETVGYFINPSLGWLQTPQDYRNRDQSFLTEQYYNADAYFYRAILPSRNEENTIIFAGTMGILRREALIGAGGWGEEYICEDAELSVRLLQAGYDSLYVSKTYGRGLIPATYEGYKKQHYRWSFGNVKILRGHFWDILALSPRQRFDYMAGSFHWFDGIHLTIIGLALAAFALSPWLGYDLMTHHEREVWLIGLVPVFLFVDGLTRLHLALRSRLGLSLGGTLRVIGMWFAVKFSNAHAALKALAGSNMPFVRTPKAPNDRIGHAAALGRAVRVTPYETLMGLLLVTATAASAHRVMLLNQLGRVDVTTTLLTIWTAYYALVFLAAPIYAYLSYVTFQPYAERDPTPTAPTGVTPS